MMMDDLDPEGNVSVTLTLSNNQTISYSMHDAEFIFSCGEEGGLNKGHWAIRGPEVTNGSQSLEIRWLNIILDDISKINPPYMYSGGAQSGEGFNSVLRNGVEYTITAATYSILKYNVIDANFSTYMAEASGSYFIEIESPTGEKESILVTFSPILQTNRGGGC